MIKMFERFERSFKLIGESFAVLKKDKELLLFPVLSAAISIAFIAVMIVPFLLGALASIGSLQAYFWLTLLVLYFVLFYISVFFSAGLIVAANIRLRGGDPRFSDGIKAASANAHRLLVWTLIAGTVGIIISAVGGNRRSFIRNIIESILRAGWELITFFVVPVIVLERKGIKDSAQRSIDMFKKTWGEAVIGQYSIGAVFFLAALLGLIPISFAFFTGSIKVLAVFLIVLLAYWTILIVLSTTLNGIYKAALYNYASGRRIKFSQEFLKAAFVRTDKK